VRNYDFKCFESSQQIIVITHETEAVKQRFDDVPLFGKLNNMFAFERQHDHKLCHYVSQLRNSSFIEFEEVFEHIHIDEDRMSAGLIVHILSIFVANGVEFAE
jgi:hypothetical protein